MRNNKLLEFLGFELPFEPWKELKSYFIITIGLLIYVFGWVSFIIPNHLVGGGISGVSALLYYATGIHVSATYFVINLILIFLGFRYIGRQFGLKTLYGIIVASLFFEYVPGWVPQALIKQVQSEHNLMLWAVVGGVFEGVGIGITFMQGGNTGGTDIIALIINRYKHINPGRVLLYCDIVIIAAALLLPDRDFLTLVYGYLMVAISTAAIDLLVQGAKQSYQILVFSTKFPEIADHVCHTMGRGVTVLKAQGWYTKMEKDVLLILVRKYEINSIYRIVKQIDPKAFISTASITGVFGEGFDPIKDGHIEPHKKAQLSHESKDQSR